LKPGEVGPVVDAARGFHVVRVFEHQTGGKTSFDKAIPEIRKKLQNKVFATEYKKIVEELRGKSHIENGLTR
jgi:parvulin-like peptidyl-prolyl isomerase